LLTAAKVQKDYRTKSSRGGIATIVLVFIVLWIAWDEIGSYLEGVEEHHFHIDGAVAREMQINLDVILAMPCSAVHVNVRDVTEDRVLATELLRKDNVRWDAGGAHELDAAGEAMQRQDVHQALHARKSKFKRIKSTSADGPACRVYGSMDVNRIQGDLHLTVRGHGYWDANLKHVDHSRRQWSWNSFANLKKSTFLTSSTNSRLATCIQNSSTLWMESLHEPIQVGCPYGA